MNTTPLQTPELPQLTFTHQGITRTLNKNPKVQHALRHGRMTLAEAKHKPWCLRYDPGTGERLFSLTSGDKEAIRAAKDILNGQQREPSTFAAFLTARDAKLGITIRQLAEEWFAAGLPFSKTKTRTPEAADTLRAATTRALNWWADVPAASVNKAMMDDFVVWRRANVARGIGDRSADLELAALSCLGQWAAFTSRIPANPFAERERYQDSKAVRHCHEVMPESDEQMQRILTWFWSVRFTPQEIGNRYKPAAVELRTRLAGGWLAFTALTGLRPEEPQELFYAPTLTETPLNPEKLLPGTVFPTRDGQTKMRIVRYKRGQNPFVTLHAPARDFLACWQAWLAQQFPDLTTARLFPNPNDIAKPLCADDTSLLNEQLTEACRQVGITQHITPKGFGRAVYVRVRRSQGVDDATIAGELGQTTNGKLIRTTYGNPGDMIGGQLFDWLPEAKDENGKPVAAPAAWQLLTETQPNIIALRAV